MCGLKVHFLDLDFTNVHKKFYAIEHFRTRVNSLHGLVS